MKNSLLFVIAVLLFATSCATPNEAEISALNYGIPPKNYEEIYKNGLKNALKDPESLQIRNVKEPKKMWSKDLYRGLSAYWIICGEYNAKNSFGGYVGYDIGAVWFKNGNFGRLNLIKGEMMGLTAKAKYPCND
ncbi:hypothetical protein ACJVC5_03510 [Peredibacter sp. HCB2-198]|uniref:hypothetical protein n=1 Tax=Peredibacter sp. HCB2-198 TaxID=3383025 RepID=UPI0038B487EC